MALGQGNDPVRGLELADLRQLTASCLSAHIPGIVWICGTPWRLNQRVLTPLMMPHIALQVERDEVRKAMRSTGALLAVWNTHWDDAEPGNWWWTCCDAKPYEVAAVSSSRGRRSIRTGLRNCSVRKLEPEEFGVMAYDIYAMARKQYRLRVPSIEEFQANALQMARYPGTEWWGSFFQNKLAAFAICQAWDGAVLLYSTKSDPALDKYNCNAALFYLVSKHYLERGAHYVTNGSRTLWHPTTINDFLRTLGFRKVYCRVHVETSALVRLVMATGIASWGKYLGLPLLRRRWEQAHGVASLLQYSRVPVDGPGAPRTESSGQG